MRRTHTVRAKFHRKYPYLVSYHNLPWNCVEAGSPAAHSLLAPHYKQLLALACRVAVPGLVAAGHPVVPELRWQQVLPGMVYLAPAAIEEAAAADAADLAPFDGWTAEQVGDTQALASYGPLHGEVAKVRRVIEFKSPDLRLLCNAVILERPHAGVSSSSALAAMDTGCVLYHYFRPNRAPSELVRPLEKFYVHTPAVDILDRLAGGAWEPVRSRKGRAAKVAPMPFETPVSYQYGLPEREAILPGDCFGHRGFMWGYRW